MFNSAASSDVFPKEMLQAVIVTLSKLGKDSTHSQNFRPISLLNSDVKICAKSLANRLLEVMPFFLDLSGICERQTGTEYGIVPIRGALCPCKYILVIEPFVEAIGSNSMIRGILVGGYEHIIQ